MPKNGDRIKGLKLWRFDAYLGGAKVDEGETESFVYCGSSTAAAIYMKVASQ